MHRQNVIAASSLLILSSAFLLIGVANETSSPRGGQTSSNNANAISFELWRNRVYLQTRINGSDPFPFILDTGASTTTISQEFARQLNLQLKNRHQEKGVGVGEGSTDISSLDSITIDLYGHKAVAKHAIAIEMGNGSANGRHPYGVLGSEIFSRYVIEIDYAAKTVSLYDSRSYIYAGPGEVVPFKLLGGSPFVKIKVEMPGLKTVEGFFMIDTGSSGGLGLNSPFVKKNLLLKSQQRFLDRSASGASGQARVLMGRAQSLRLGSSVIQRPVAHLSQAKEGASADSSYDGTIGGEILRRFKVIFDYSRERMILESNAHYDESYEYDMSGIFLLAEGKDYKTYRIGHVFEDTPAAEAQLREGDIIEAIDGKSASEFTLSQLQLMFRQEGKQYLMIIRRGDQIIEVKIGMRRLV